MTTTLAYAEKERDNEMGKREKGIYREATNKILNEIAQIYDAAYESGYENGIKQNGEPQLDKGWIPARERPNQTDEYLVTVVVDGATFVDKFGFTPTDGWYDPENPNQYKINWNKYVVAWQEMPKPYNIGDVR